MNRLPEPLDEVLFPAELFRPESVDKPAADDGVVADSRLTATLGASLVLILSAVGVTLLDVEGLIEWHAGLGIAAGVVVLVKLTSTGYRLVRYYTRDGRYVASGPPFIVLRLLAPLLVVLTASVIGTGIVTLYEPDTIWLTLHKASFWGWIICAATHVLAYVWRLPKVIGAPRGQRPRPRTAPAVTAVVAIVTLALAVGFAVWFVMQMPALPVG